MTKKELLPLAKTYFDSNPNREFIFGTEDKHFYNSEGDAKCHCKEEKEYFYFTKADFVEKPVVKEVIKAVKVESPKEVKEVKKADFLAKMAEGKVNKNNKK